MAVRIRINFELPRMRRPPLGRREARDLIVCALRATLAAHDIDHGELSLTLLDDDAIAAINVQYLAHDGPTDVITFALHGEGEMPLGDIYVGWEQMLRQAAEFGVSPREELARLAVHGALHVLGHEHPEGPERERSSMWIRQEQILREVLAT